MARRLADLIDQAQRRFFVGRAEELAVLERMIGADPQSHHILHVHGPGGIGKTTLLDRYRDLLRTDGWPVVDIDGQHADPVHESFEEPLSTAGAFDDHDGRLAVVIDTYEQFRRLDDWFVDEVLPRLGEHVVVIVAGRNAPGPTWRQHPGVWSLCRDLALRRLTETEARSYLRQRGVAEDAIPEMLGFTHGNPLALSLAADVAANNPDAASPQPHDRDVIAALIERLRVDAPDEQHRVALETAAVVPATTEGLLANTISEEAAPQLFAWLGSLSFITTADVGVAPHEVARHALVSDLRWRNPGRYRDIHARVRHHFSSGVQATSGADQDRMVRGLMYLHRDHPVIAPYLDWDTMAQHRAGPARTDDVSGLVEMVRRHEGDASAAIAARRLPDHVDSTVAIRGRNGDLEGFVHMIGIGYDDLDPADTSHDDPAVRAAHGVLAHDMALRPGETATLFRWWMSADTHQGVSGVQSAVFAVVVRHYLATRGLAVTLFPVADEAFWSPGLAYADLQRAPAADFEVAGRRCAVFAHDWRVRPPGQWLAMLADRETSGELEAESERPEPLIVMNRDDLATATDDALRGYARPETLVDNPLLRSRIVVDRTAVSAGIGERVEVLRDLVRTAVATLDADPRTEKQHAALHATFMNPAPSQEAAAEAVHMAFSTYRRHLVSGRTSVAEQIWRRDLGEV